MARTATGELCEIGSMAVRLAKVVRRLEKFSFPLVAAPLAGLLTRRENHVASARIESLIHLAALACRGDRAPDRRHLRQWLNDAIYEDPITKLETPVEDVFVSNVDAWFGNTRLFEGRWQNNAAYVRVCVETLLRVQERPWVSQTLGHVMALLRVSEAVAERAGIARNSRTAGRPGEKNAVGASSVSRSTGHVGFRDDELAAIGVSPGALGPFLVQGEDTDVLVSQSMGHTVLERRPLVRFKGRTTVALPTAIGAAIRRFVIERASAAGDLRLFQSTFHLAQFTEVAVLGCADWKIRCIDVLEPDPDDGMREVVGTFDEGGFVHLVFVPDDFESIAQGGLAGTHALEGAVRARIQDRAAELAGARDCRRGLTVLVHGGIGREFSPVWGELPHGWHQLCVSAPDFVLLGNETGFTAMRAWKLLHQVDDLEAQGTIFPNLRGFLNLAAFAYHVGFELVPVEMSPGPIYLHSDFILPLRHAVRTGLDRHAAMAPDGKSWVGVERPTSDGRFDEIQGRAVFFSPGHKGDGEVLACLESASRPWWVQCGEVPEHRWHQGIVSNVLEMVVGWLARLVPALEERCPTLRSGPVAFRIRFSDIGTFSQRDAEVRQTPVAPTVALEDGGIAIDCVVRYLRSFLSPGNLGDRLMIAAMVRGVDSLCGEEAVSEAALEEWVRSLVESDSARFLKMTPSQTMEDVVYDVAGLPEPRVLMPEDRAWSRFDLVRRAGYEGKPGAIPSSRADRLLHAAVDAAWERVRARLMDLSRESVIERSLLNYIALRKEHRDWLRATAARLAVYDAGQVMTASNERVVMRDQAGLACRVIAEMALCASPYGSGSVCMETDLDFMIAEVSTLVECASQSDALRYGLATQPPVMYRNGSFGFDPAAAQATGPLMSEHWRRSFRDAAQDEESGGEGEVEEAVPEPEFPSAFAAEFGLTVEQYAAFVQQVALEAVELDNAYLRLPRSEVLRRLRDGGASDAERAFASFTLAPRDQWDESQPVNAEARDWYPWRFNRRLSIMRRPLVQLSREDDPVVIVVPSILAGTLSYVGQAAFGDLPESLFESPEMRACVGKAADRNGHEFARRVAKRLAELKWETAQEVSLTRFGGDDSLGDVDVLGWQRVTGLVYAIECKSLRFDRTIAEVGGRLAEYSAGTVGAKRTSLQKHLDRMSCLEANRERVADFTEIPLDLLQVRSGLVTENLGSMQFGGKAREMLDLVTDYELLEDALPN